jgi:hypothetical protein
MSAASMLLWLIIALIGIACIDVPVKISNRPAAQFNRSDLRVGRAQEWATGFRSPKTIDKDKNL